MNLTNEFEPIIDWAEKRGIYKNGNINAQYDKLIEEVEELRNSIVNKDKLEFIDAIGDCIVVLTNLAHLEGVSVEECINTAYNVIKNRKGTMENGTFVKE